MKQQEKWVLGLAFVIFIWLLMNLGAFNIRVISSSERTLDVNGESTISVMPDKAEILVYVYTEGSEASTVQSQNSEIMDQVISDLESINENNISSYSYYLSPRTTWNETSGESYVYGYSLRHTIKITTFNLSNVGNIVDTSVVSGANGISGITFGLSEALEKQSYSEGLSKAGELAEAKANAMADSLSVSLIGISTITESGASYSPYRFEAAVGMDAGTQITPEEVDVRATVQVSYLIQ